MSACCKDYPNCEHTRSKGMAINNTTAEPTTVTNGVLSVASLNWKPIEAPEHAPELKCDECHQMHPANGQLGADIKVDNWTTFSIVVCSDRCLYLFKRRKGIDLILRETVNNIRKKIRMQAIRKMGR